jgi:membrane protease YdiL (CAAX protease family)
VNVLFRTDGILRAGWRVLLGILVAIVANMLAASLAAGQRRGELSFDLVYRPLAMVLLIAGFSLLERFADQVNGSPLAAQGLGRPHWGRDFIAGVAIGAALIGIGVAAMAALGQVSFQTAWSSRSVGPLVAVLWVLITAAMTEELMFRGYPFQRLVEGLGAVPAIMVLSILFGLAHWTNPHVSDLAVLNTILVGVLLAVAYLRTRALWLPWGIHLAWNATLGVAFGLPVSGLSFAVMVKGTALGPVWLTGGDYGLEGSFVATAVILLGFIPVVKFFHPPLRSAPQIERGDGISASTGHPTFEGSVRHEGEPTQPD